MGRPKGSKNKPKNVSAQDGGEEVQLMGGEADEFGQETDIDGADGVELDPTEFPPDDDLPPPPSDAQSDAAPMEDGGANADVFLPLEPAEAPRPESLPIVNASADSASADEKREKRERKPREARKSSGGSKTTRKERLETAMMFGGMIDAVLTKAASLAGSDIRAQDIPVYNRDANGGLHGIPFDINTDAMPGSAEFMVDRAEVTAKGETKIIVATPGFAIAYNLASNGKDGMEKIKEWMEENEDTVRTFAALGIVGVFGYAVMKDRKRKQSEEGIRPQESPATE